MELIYFYLNIVRQSLLKEVIPPQTEKAMAPHSSTLAWKITWTEEPGGLESMGSQRVGRNLVTK